MAVVSTSWVDNIGQLCNAAYLNNLGTEVNGKYVKPGSGIPSTDMAAAVVTSLGKADTATQPANLVTAQLVTINAQTNDYTLVATDVNKSVEMNKATAVSVTVPLNSSVPFTVGTVIEIVQVGAGQVTVVATGGVTVNTHATLLTRAQWSTLGLRKRATDVWILTGDAA